MICTVATTKRTTWGNVLDARERVHVGKGTLVALVSAERDDSYIWRFDLLLPDGSIFRTSAYVEWDALGRDVTRHRLFEPLP